MCAWWADTFVVMVAPFHLGVGSTMSEAADAMVKLAIK
jgi:hypothetical protein